MPEGSPEEPQQNARGKIAAIGVSLLLLLGGYFLMNRLGDMAATQDCVATGHRDCGQSDTSAH